MPIVLVAIPIAEVLAAAAVALGAAVLANRGRGRRIPLSGPDQTTAPVFAQEAAGESATESSETTTVVGKGELNCGENGTYGDMLKKTGNNKYDRDHVPSKGALQQAAWKLLAERRIRLTKAQRDALFGDRGLISKAGNTIIIPKKDHAAHSDTYGARNTPEKIKADAEDLQKASKKDTKAIEEGDGKEMDPDCLDKYKKAAEEINKKTHEQYLADLERIIRETIDKIRY